MRRVLIITVVAAALLQSQTGWVVTPAGRQIPVSTFPMSLALSPDGRYVLALNAGFAPPSISVVDTAAERETARVPLEDAWLGLVFSVKGDRVYVGGGSRPVVWELQFDRGQLKPARRFPVAKEAHENDYVGEVALSPDGRFLYAANLFRNTITMMNAQTGFIVNEVPTGRRPSRIVFAPDGKTFYVSHWADGTVGQYNAPDGKKLETIQVGAHPTDLVYLAGKVESRENGPSYAARLFVACANTNAVTVLGITEGNQAVMIDRIPLAASRATPLGTTPSALALSPDRTRLYVVCSGINSVAVVDVSEYTALPLGLIPTGWYPTAVRAAANGKLFIANARGGGSTAARPTTGSVSALAVPTDAQLEANTEQALANSPYDDSQLADAGGPKGHPVPSAPGETSPIRYVVYIVKGSRSYDEIFGDAAAAPNHHKLAREFVLLDNFYSAGETGIDGLHWATASIASDFVEKLAPAVAAGRLRGVALDGAEPAAFPPTGYLWTNLRAAGLPFRNYGFWVENAPGLSGVARARDASLEAETDKSYLGPAAAYPDSKRADAFIRDFGERAQKGTLPRALLVRLPGASDMADHDAALGRIVEAISRSPVWGRTAIFVTESGGGAADHVDSHRTAAWVVSPYAKRGAVDNTHYTTDSMLRTIELILGLRPLTQFDAAATPMFECFGATPDPRPYSAAKP